MFTMLVVSRKVNLVVKNSDIKQGKSRILVERNGKIYDANTFEFVEGDGKAYDLNESHRENVNEMLPKAEKMVQELIEKTKETHTPTAPEPSGRPSIGLLEQALMKSLAEVSMENIIEDIKPDIDAFIKAEYGVKPEKHHVKTDFSDIIVNEITHEKFDTILNLVGADIPVMLTGPAGTGKNYLVKQVADALELDFYFSNSVTQEYKITGFIDANGRYHETEFYKAFKNGGIFMLDEVDASIPEVLVILNAGIANRYFDFPTGRINAHPDFRVVSAGNTFGTGADMEYVGRNQLDSATLDRFALVEIHYSEKIERALANNNLELVKFVRDLRDTCLEMGLQKIFSYRGISMVTKLEQTNMEIDEILKITLFKGLQKDDLYQLMDMMNNNNKYHKVLKRLVA